MIDLVAKYQKVVPVSDFRKPAHIRFSPAPTRRIVRAVDNNHPSVWRDSPLDFVPVNFEHGGFEIHANGNGASQLRKNPCSGRPPTSRMPLPVAAPRQIPRKTGVTALEMAKTRLHGVNPRRP